MDIIGEGSKTYLGVLTADSDDIPVLDTSTDLALSISDDLLNRGVFEVWRAGGVESVCTAGGKMR